jgi:hypothetical protein
MTSHRVRFSMHRYDEKSLQVPHNSTCIVSEVLRIHMYYVMLIVCWTEEMVLHCMYNWSFAKYSLTIAILNVIHRLSFIWNSTELYRFVCPYLTRNTLRLLYEPNRLMLTISLWRWYINITIAILNSIHRPVFYFKHGVSETGVCLPLQLEPSSLVPIDRDSFYPWRTFRRLDSVSVFRWTLRSFTQYTELVSVSRDKE